MSILILILGRPFASYHSELFFYSSMAGLAVLIPRFVNPSRGWLFALIRYLYPGAMLAFFYLFTAGTMFLLFDHFLDASLTQFERELIGVNLTLLIDREYLNVWVTEIVSFCYFAYYPMIPVYVFSLFITKRYELLQKSFATICLTFFCGYMLFFLFPIEGPRWFYRADYINQVQGPLFRQMVDWVIANGAVRGGCMPSTHFAVALVILLYCFKHFKKTAWLLLPVDIGLAAGTVWGRFHYLSDVIVGGIIGATAYWFVEKHYANWVSSRLVIDKEQKLSKTNVS
ncbi:MAG: phosphatase PAP2 family protein [bacterium]|nr:phosphatase PAP2 family protein [bacterium]